MIMANKFARLLWNSLRWIGNPAYKQLLAVESSTRISTSHHATLNIGNGFRTRHNVEINVRDNAVVEIGSNVFLNSGCIITAREKVIIGNHTIFGPNVIVYDNDHKVCNGRVLDNEYETAPVTIGSNVWIGAGAVILKGSYIGDHCVIAAGSVIKGRIESNHMVIQKRNTELRLIRGCLEVEQNEI